MHAVETSSGRTALHKAAFWGHDALMDFLLNDCKISVNAKDNEGDTALHDAARFGHGNVVKSILASGADRSIRNSAGKRAVDLAAEYEKPEVVAILGGSKL